MKHYTNILPNIFTSIMLYTVLYLLPVGAIVLHPWSFILYLHPYASNFIRRLSDGACHILRRAYPAIWYHMDHYMCLGIATLYTTIGASIVPVFVDIEAGGGYILAVNVIVLFVSSINTSRLYHTTDFSNLFRSVLLEMFSESWQQLPERENSGSSRLADNTACFDQGRTFNAI